MCWCCSLIIHIGVVDRWKAYNIKYIQNKKLNTCIYCRDKNLLHSYSGTKTDDLWPSIKMLIKNLLTEENKRAPKNM